MQLFNTQSTSLRLILLAAIVAAVTFSSFSGALKCGFVPLDDPSYAGNQTVKEGFNFKNFLWSFQATQEGNWHPLAWMSHMIDNNLYGANPKGHHLTGLLIHIASGILCLLLFFRITRDYAVSFLIALFFAIHPLRVESVAWIAERKDVLCVFFGLLSMLFYMEYVLRHSRAAYVCCLVSAMLGLLSKAMLVTLPFLFFLLDYWPLNRFKSFDKTLLRGLIWEKVPFFIGIIFVCIITFLTADQGEAMFLADSLSPWLRIQNVGISYVRYLGKLFYPVSLGLMYPLRFDEGTFRRFVFSIILLIGITGLFFYHRKKRPYLLVGWMWYVVTLLPVIGIVQIGPQAIADRFTYLPCLGILCILFMMLLAIMRKHWALKSTGIILLTAAGLYCMAATDVQVSYWQNGFTLYKHALDVEDSPFIRLMYGGGLEIAGQYDAAFEQYNKVHAYNPQESSPLILMARTRMKQGLYTEALDYLGKVNIKEKKPSEQALIYDLYAACLRSTQPEQAADYAIQACTLTDYQESGYLKTLALCYEAKNDYSNAVKIAEKAIAILKQQQKTEGLAEIEAIKKRCEEKLRRE